MKIALEPANQPDVIALIEELDVHLKPLYPTESQHGIDLTALAAPNVIFAVARDERGRALGCGAIVVGDDYCEVKRMFTRPSHRGMGIARGILATLESQAIARGCRIFALETGYLQPEAIALYERLGYVRCGPFGSYVDDPNSVFMQKVAARAQGAAGSDLDAGADL